jgi:hypothetical protein
MKEDMGKYWLRERNFQLEGMSSRDLFYNMVTIF